VEVFSTPGHALYRYGSVRSRRRKMEVGIAFVYETTCTVGINTGQFGWRRPYVERTYRYCAASSEKS
jgi:hypothetical protein